MVFGVKSSVAQKFFVPAEQTQLGVIQFFHFSVAVAIANIPRRRGVHDKRRLVGIAAFTVDIQRGQGEIRVAREGRREAVIRHRTDVQKKLPVARRIAVINPVARHRIQRRVRFPFQLVRRERRAKKQCRRQADKTCDGTAVTMGRRESEIFHRYQSLKFYKPVTVAVPL